MDKVKDPTNGQLRRALEGMREGYSIRGACPDAHYMNKEDFVLRHGRFFEPQSLPARYRRRRGEECFANAFKLARKAGLRYAEGVAIATSNTSPVPFPIHHAWCVDVDNRAVDPTWPTPGFAYFGVVFDLERVADVWSTQNRSVLDDWANKWPALREPYTEPAPAVC
jgi:hypothetical protein